MLLVIDPAVYRAVPELRIIEAVHIRAKALFLKELLQVMGMKLGHFCHGLGKPSSKVAAVFELSEI